MANRYKEPYKGKYADIKQGVRSDIGPMFFRSSWEANYARYLNWLIVHNQILRWEFEPQTFWFEGIKRGTMSYLPDFKVYNHDGSNYFVEVKGYMDAKSKTKLSRMKKYHPNVKIVLIRSKQYRKIERNHGMMISGWEFA